MERYMTDIITAPRASAPRLSTRARSARPSPTIAMNARAAALKVEGKTSIPLSLGEPDFHTPDNVKAAGIKAIEDNFTKYTPSDGHKPLKAAIVQKLKDYNGLTFDADQIVVSGGCKSALLAAFLSIVDPGEEVIIPTPYWVSYPDLVELAGGKPVFVPCDDTVEFKLTPELLEAAITPKTRAVVFNSPNNPSGAVYSPEDIERLAEVLLRHPEIWVVTDEMYEWIVYETPRAVSFAEIVAKAAPEVLDRVITINGFSKGYVMTGWRLAYCAGSKAVIKSMADFLSQMNGAPSSISQAAAIEALQGDQSFITRNQNIFRERRDLVVDRIAGIPGLSTIRPPGSFFIYIHCGGWLGRTSPGGIELKTDMDVVEALLVEEAVATVPGEVFGLSPYFRISYALDLTLINEAMDRIESFAKALR